MDTLRGRFDTSDITGDLSGDLSERLTDDLHDYEASDEQDELDAPPSPVGQDERRMQVRAYNHWASLLGDQNFPAIEDLDPETLEDFGPFSVLLDFTSGIENPGIQYLGRKLADECGADVEIERLADVPSLSLLSRITDHYMQILANQAPIGFEAEFVNQRGSTVMYRGILLPYSSNNETIDFIYGVINWKEVADKQTADELLLEIDQALGTATDDDSPDSSDDDILDLGEIGMVEEGGEERVQLPEPAFGEEQETEAGLYDDTSEFDTGDLSDEGGLVNAEAEENVVFTQPVFDSDEVNEDGEELIEDDDYLPSLMGISIGKHGAPREDKKPFDPSSFTLEPQEAAPAVPVAYEPDADAPIDLFSARYEAATPVPSEPEELSNSKEEVASDGPAGLEPVGFGEEAVHNDAEAANNDVEEAIDDAETDLTAASEPAAAEPVDLAAFSHDAEPEGLHECLALAREIAYTARSSEDRSRGALYEAVGRAYDVSLEAQAAPEEFAELLEDNGMSVQGRAPMTPVVKLVFGADYDKTRLTEYATVLSHAHRVKVERGALTQFLRNAEGGLKEVVRTERRLRREEKGETVEVRTDPRPALAKKLRALPETSLADLPIDGPEFALVMVRRTEEGELVVLGEVPADVGLVERAGRKLIG
ncbi:PAS domain-containing protein [Qipengyuania atrilutea]|uniref:Uncharacterized protein n=1 Tax=Qipengyuania atrilutea TaxID=2744473 RepID=A0A850GY67_9SPHN|nr:hypothetical protein [Actirhodobacter atriluteus]